MKARAILALLLTAACAAAAVYQVHAAQQTPHAAALTSYVPQDALLTIASPDFAMLLHQWTNSAQSKSWLSSDNYAVFQNSRLFGRLSDAQTSYAQAAGIPAGAGLLHELAGKESVFAWYDIGKLEFLYITRMPAAQAQQTRLFQARGTFARRHAGNADFYIRNSNSSDDGNSTVAFADVPTASGDLVLLATREDLIANALTLIASSGSGSSIEQEPWFHDASSALPAEPAAPALRMVLNLDRIAYDPHFRSYWIQRNISWTRQFRAAASDLYTGAAQFREERVLLPKSAEPEAGNASVVALAALAPPAAGVVRAEATHDPAVAITAIREKLLGSSTAPATNPEQAPDPELQTPQTGSASDLETRIDVLPPESASASTNSLAQLLQSADLDAVLTVSSAQLPSANALWVPIHSAVVIHTANPDTPQTFASALEQALQGALTAGNIGSTFQSREVQGATLYALTGPHPLFFAVASNPTQGNLVLLTDDQALLVQLLHPLASSSQGEPAPATFIGVFDHASQRDPYLRLSSLIDGTNNQPQDTRKLPAPVQGGAAEASPPTFFSRNVGSLSNTFADLQSERVVERTAGDNLRQTVTYTWLTR